MVGTASKLDSTARRSALHRFFVAQEMHHITLRALDENSIAHAPVAQGARRYVSHSHAFTLSRNPLHFRLDLFLTDKIASHSPMLQIPRAPLKYPFHKRYQIREGCVSGQHVEHCDRVHPFKTMTGKINRSRDAFPPAGNESVHELLVHPEIPVKELRVFAVVPVPRSRGHMAFGLKAA